MMKFRFILLLLPFLYFSASAQTKLVQIDGNGKLSYTKDSDGFVIPNFSHAGYRGGGVEIPVVATVKTISAISGDNTARIQAAIDEVGQRTPDANGHRGALLLKAGRYEIEGTLQVKYSGVVIRGEGNGTSATNSTILFAKGNTPHQRDVIVLGNTKQNRWTSKEANTQKNITDNLVAVGSYSFTVSSSASYQIGDEIAIYHPCTIAWLAAINYGGVPAPAEGEADERWVANQYPIFYHRYIKNIEGNKITVDAPIFYNLNKSLAQSYIYKIASSGTTEILKEIGIENLRVDIESLGGEDENHAWQAITFRTTENSWAKNVVASGFGQSGFLTDCATRCTIKDCEALDPVSIITGERRYNFNTYVNSQLILFKNCYARNGRHHYVSNGTSSASGNVFQNCISDATNSVSEGHRHWTQGMLYDNHKEKNMKREFVLGLYNRIDMGTGHGWATVQSVLWNCDVSSSGIIGLQKPPTSQNYAIGCTAKSITGKPINDSDFTIGYVELQNKPVAQIPSLYEAQLNARRLSSGIKESVVIEKPYNIDTTQSNVLKLQFVDTNLKKLNVFTLQGKRVYTQKTREQNISINFALSGIYVLKMQIGEKIYSEKIIL